LLGVAEVLIQRGSPGEDDWMLFTAARHVNAIKPELFDPVRATELNLKVGKIASAKGSFVDAVDFFRAGVGRLDPKNCWMREHYDLTLDLYNNLLEGEHTIGHEEQAAQAVEVVFKNARSLPEKLRAQYVYVESKVAGQSYGASVDSGLEILGLYDVEIPTEPTERQLNREKFQLKVALRGRSLLCLSKFPIATEEAVIAQMKIAQITLRHASFDKRSVLASMVGIRMLRVALKNRVITKDLPFLVLSLGAPLRQREKYEGAATYANAGMSLMERFPEEKGGEFLKAKIALYGQLICLRMSFRDAIETFLELNKELLAIGASDQAMAAGMLSMFSFLNASLPLGTLFEPKLILFQEMATNLGKKMFVVIFGFIRQFLYNLQGGSKASSTPTVLDGVAFNEEEVLAKFEGPPKKMNIRDVGTIRLQLAVIFDDEAVMDEMLDRLDSYPVHDIPIARQHIRMTYVGFASLILGNKTDKHKKWADTCMDFFEKLSRFGSPNAQPVHLCLKALKTPSIASFDEAIQTVESFGLLNLTALMNERCGLWLMENADKRPEGTMSNGIDDGSELVNERCGLWPAVSADKRRGKTGVHNVDNSIYQNYLKNAVWYYHDWGATGKVAHMQSRFQFLQGAVQEKPPSLLSSVRRQTAMLGVPRPAPLTASSM